MTSHTPFNSAEVYERVEKMAGIIMKGDVTREDYKVTAARIISFLFDYDADEVLKVVETVESEKINLKEKEKEDDGNN